MFVRVNLSQGSVRQKAMYVGLFLSYDSKECSICLNSVSVVLLPKHALKDCLFIAFFIFFFLFVI